MSCQLSGWIDSSGEVFLFGDYIPVICLLFCFFFFFLLVWCGGGDLSTSVLSPFLLDCTVWITLQFQAGFSHVLSMLEETQVD